MKPVQVTCIIDADLQPSPYGSILVVMKTFCFVLLITGLLALPVSAQQAPARIDVASLGPQVGDRIADFSLEDQQGAARTLDSIMGPNGAMLVFSRSVDW